MITQNQINSEFHLEFSCSETWKLKFDLKAFFAALISSLPRLSFYVCPVLELRNMLIKKAPVFAGACNFKQCQKFYFFCCSFSRLIAMTSSAIFCGTREYLHISMLKVAIPLLIPRMTVA